MAFSLRGGRDAAVVVVASCSFLEGEADEEEEEEEEELVLCVSFPGEERAPCCC